MFRFKQNVSFVLKPLMSHTLVLKTPARGVSSVYRYKSRYLYRKLDIHRMVNMKAHELLKQLYDFYIRMGGAKTNFYAVIGDTAYKCRHECHARHSLSSGSLPETLSD